MTAVVLKTISDDGHTSYGLEEYFFNSYSEALEKCDRLNTDLQLSENSANGDQGTLFE